MKLIPFNSFEVTMKILFFFFLLSAVAFSQSLPDSTVSKQITARQMVVTVNYGGVTDQLVITAEEVAGWIGTRGISSEGDTTRPINTALLGHLRAEIQRCYQAWVKNRDTELGLIDQDDNMTLAQIRVAKQAIRLKYRQYQYNYTIPRP